MVDLNLEDFLYQLSQLGVKLAVKGEQLSVTGNLKAIDGQTKIKLKAHKAAIIEFVRGKQNEVPAIVPTARSTPLPLSFAQQRLWLVEQITPGTDQFNMPMALRFKGALNVQALQQALNTIVARHEVLRTVYHAGERNEGQQQIRAVGEVNLEYSDLAQLSTPQSRQQRLEQLIQKNASDAFDLAQDLMLRAHLVKETEDSHVLLLSLHHIAADGWSMGVLSNELGQLYQAFAQGQANPLAPLPLQYGDYAQWQRQWLRGSVLESHLSYWQRQLAGLPECHSLPKDRPYPAVFNHQGKDHHQLLSKALLDGLNQLARSHDATLFMVLNGALAALIYRYSEQSDVVIGTAVANREQPGLADLVGFFINTLVIRNQVDGNAGFSALLAQSKQTLLDAYEHQQVPFEQLVDRLKSGRHLDHHPLFQIMLSLQNNQSGGLQLPGMDIEVLDQQSASAKYDLTLSANERDDGLAIRWNFATELFDEQTIEAMAGHFERLIAQLIAQPQCAIDDLALWDESQQKQIVQDWSQGPVQTIDNRIGLIDMVKRQDSNKIALIDHKQALSFGELMQNVTQMAAVLSQQGVGRGDIVALCCAPGNEMVVAMLAIWRLRAAYLPLDIDSPEGRLHYMLDDSKAKLVLVDDQAASLLATSATKQLAITIDEANLQAGAFDECAYDAEQTAYIMYTSGSTGKPKPVEIKHRNLVNFRYVFARQLADLSLADCDAWLLSSSMAFDPSVKGLLALAMGMKLVVASALAAKSPEQLLALCAEHQLPVLNGTPTLMRAVLKSERLQQVKPALIVGGEAIDQNLWQQISDYCHQNNRRAINAYGPTEATINACYCRIDEHSHANIGRPVVNTQAYVVDSRERPVPVGVVGELCLAGAGLACGYRNQAQLTAERFTSSTELAQAGVLYRTGDWVKWDNQGHLRFVGRRDEQVKRSGYRIDLTEVESILNDSGLLDAVALVNVADKPLVACYVANSKDDEMLLPQLKAHAQHHLPHYAQPQKWLELVELPQLISGKVDRNALSQKVAQLDLSVAYTAPATDAERLICALAAEVLELPSQQVGSSDNFFALGGNSLTGVGLIAQINAHTGVELPLQQLFSAADFAALGFELVKRQLLAIEDAEAFEQCLADMPEPLAERLMDALEAEMA